jgi:hypothetical protein
MHNYRDALRAEITFWQELLDDSGLNKESPVFQRMVQAIRLAKFKLKNHHNSQHLH